MFLLIYSWFWSPDRGSQPSREEVGLGVVYCRAKAALRTKYSQTESMHSGVRHLPASLHSWMRVTRVADSFDKHNKLGGNNRLLV